MTSSRSRANSSFTSYDHRMERQLTGSQRPRSPYRMSGNGSIPTTRVSPLTASNHLFSAPNNGYSTTSTTPTHHLRGMLPSSRLREESPGGGSAHQYQRTNSSNGQIQMRQTTPSSGSHQIPQMTSSVRAHINSKSNTPLHSRLGNAITETESTVCECLLSALIGIESRLFTPIHRKMTITSTASISTTHLAVCQRVLSVANIYLLLSHKENPYPDGMHVTTALLAAIRSIIGDYIGDIDELRRMKGLRFHHCLPLIDKWSIRLNIVAMAHKIRHLPQLDLLENLYILNSAYSFEEDRRVVLNKIMDYCMGVYCSQMMEWMTTGEVPVDKWIIGKDAQNRDELVLRKIPIFMSDEDARIVSSGAPLTRFWAQILDFEPKNSDFSALKSIFHFSKSEKSLPHVHGASDEDLESIDRTTTVVRGALCPKLIFQKELTACLMILRDVVCGIVMRMVLTTGRLKEHILKATSFFFLSDPRFTATLYSVIKEASLGLRPGSASLTRQQVSSALAAALEACTSTNSSHSDSEDRKKQKLKFKLDAMTSLGSTPNVSSKMQFVTPLSPHYEPHLDLMKPIFSACDSAYESIFHVLWAIELARFSCQETSTQNLPGIMRFLLRNYSLRENATCLLNTLSHVFCIINSSLLRLRSHISIQLRQLLSRFLAAIDEKCVDVDDVIREHLKFTRHVSVVVFVRNNERIEHELANLLRVAFEAQDLTKEFVETWSDVIDQTDSDENVRKARIAECCQKRTIAVRILLETVNKCHKNLMELLDEQITYGNDALLE
ncbi:hypothetical protein GCK72_011467 [Caenorhabditis remanei]|uniref:Gamma tubulin complex component C-terminal domain-containing protein n=1 Tax=Caenorhabditis remanei TaxID=31234 RepID=A0A6A5H8N6_CAERE|nr:hypothetical protein GCK72_011467 [Caenorhabditis remanei]KAF1763201.1 hypothetical protein GCK72_011467 [Caenorhabditis remanei]